MEIKEAMNLIDDGWIKKPKGFRVRFKELVDGNKVVQYVPGLESKLLDSDVVAWRLAWKLAQLENVEGEENDRTKKYINITVVDDSDCPIKYYVTNELEYLNPEEGCDE